MNKPSKPTCFLYFRAKQNCRLHKPLVLNLAHMLRNAAQGWNEGLARNLAHMLRSAAQAMKNKRKMRSRHGSHDPLATPRTAWSDHRPLGPIMPAHHGPLGPLHSASASPRVVLLPRPPWRPLPRPLSHLCSASGRPVFHGHLCCLGHDRGQSF